MSESYVLLIYKFSPADETVERLVFDSKEEMSTYVTNNIEAGSSCLYYPETALPFKDGWDELQRSSHAVFG